MPPNAHLMYLDNQRIDMKKVKLVVNRYQKDAGLQSEYFNEAVDAEVFQSSQRITTQSRVIDGWEADSKRQPDREESCGDGRHAHRNS